MEGRVAALGQWGNTVAIPVVKRGDSWRFGWPWCPFVILALGSALVPGFGFGFLMGMGTLSGEPAGGWYRATAQAHGHAMLTGWGGAMILGVALHFLPRLRGTRLAFSVCVPHLFWWFVSGLTLRTLGQPLLALTEAGTSGAPAWGALWQVAVGTGILFQFLAVAGLLVVLGKTLASGPALDHRKGFRQIAPFLAIAATAVLAANLILVSAVIDAMVAGRSLAVLPHRFQDGATTLLLFGFVTSVSLAMSARLFPLHFRVRFARPWVLVASWLTMASGVVVKVLSVGFAPKLLDHWLALAGLLFALGMAFGAAAVRMFEPRRPYPGGKPYRVRSDPAGIGAITAYGWLCVGAILLAGAALHELTGGLAPFSGARDAARHAVGSGFMTLLIAGVGWTMLPGFAGGEPRRRGLIWAAVVSLNAATLLRVVPWVAAACGASLSGGLTGTVYALAGGLGLAGIGAFGVALLFSFRPPAGRGKSFLPMTDTTNR